jgi:hypothetical protein
MAGEHFYNLHKGETALLVGNGPNLTLTPPEWFGFPSFGVNTIHLYDGWWKPTYYAAVDTQVRKVYGDAIAAKFPEVPKFVPERPTKWQGENFYYFYHRPSAEEIWIHGQSVTRDFLTRPGITYFNVTHVTMQIALFMGFKTLLMIGIQHREQREQVHFWGTDHSMAPIAPHQWFDGYVELVREFRELGVEVLNISEDTSVPEKVLPRGDWRNYASKNS